MTIYIFDMDGTLTPARKPMTENFKTAFLPWLKSHTAFIATGSDYTKVKEQLWQDIIDNFAGIFCSMGNTLYIKDKLVHKKEMIYDTNLLNDLENFRKNTKYPNKLFGNYIEKRIGMINFSVIGRDCSYEEREKYTAWDKLNLERLEIQKILSKKYIKYNFELGGNISIDIIPKGYGKEQIANNIRNSYPNDKIIFFGDRTYKGGNDYALAYKLSTMNNTQIVQVEGPNNVLELLLNKEI